MKYIGQDAFFYGDITTLTNLHVQGNVDVYGTSNFNGPVNFTGAISGLPPALGLDNVAHTAPSDLPLSNAATTAVALKANLENPDFSGNIRINKCQIGVSNSATVQSLYVNGSTRITNYLLLGGDMVLGNLAQKLGMCVDAESSIQTQ